MTKPRLAGFGLSALLVLIIGSILFPTARADVGERFGQAGQTASHSGEEGLTTVTLDLPDMGHWQKVVEALESRGDLVEVAPESFGEGA